MIPTIPIPIPSHCMKNPHIIVGESSRCLCGCWLEYPEGIISTESTSICCVDVIRVLNKLENCHNKKLGIVHAPAPEDAEIMLLLAAIGPLVKECI